MRKCFIPSQQSSANMQYEVSLDPETNLAPARLCELAYRPMFL